MTIQDEDRHSLILVEHDPMLYEDASEMTENVSEALQQVAQEAAVLAVPQGFTPEYCGPRPF